MAIGDWMDTLASWGGAAQEASSDLGLGTIDWNPFHSPFWNTSTPTVASTAVAAPAPARNLTPYLLGGGVLLAVYLLSRRSRR
jgi:hypothetical protein